NPCHEGRVVLSSFALSRGQAPGPVRLSRGGMRSASLRHLRAGHFGRWLIRRWTGRPALGARPRDTTIRARVSARGPRHQGRGPELEGGGMRGVARLVLPQHVAPPLAGLPGEHGRPAVGARHKLGALTSRYWWT